MRTISDVDHLWPGLILFVTICWWLDNRLSRTHTVALQSDLLNTQRFHPTIAKWCLVHHKSRRDDGAGGEVCPEPALLCGSLIKSELIVTSCSPKCAHMSAHCLMAEVGWWGSLSYNLKVPRRRERRDTLDMFWKYDAVRNPWCVFIPSEWQVIW